MLLQLNILHVKQQQQQKQLQMFGLIKQELNAALMQHIEQE